VGLGGFLFYVGWAVNPIGGLAVAIPFAVIKAHYPPWFVILSGVPLAYVQVIVVDLAWTTLERWPRWLPLIERRRSARLERLAASGGAFLPTTLLAPFVGPWLVMAVMRYARVPQRRVMAPILLGLAWMATVLATISVYAPSLLHRYLAGPQHL